MGCYHHRHIEQNMRDTYIHQRKEIASGISNKYGGYIGGGCSKNFWLDGKN